MRIETTVNQVKNEVTNSYGLRSSAELDNILKSFNEFSKRVIKVCSLLDYEFI